MKNTVAAIVLMVMPSFVFADGITPNNYAVITSVHPIYQDQYAVQYQTQCHDVQVPIYGREHSGSSGDVLAGAIIGGAIGNQFGSGDGKDAMTALGIIIGANQGSRSTREVVTGYRLEQRCEQVSYQTIKPVLSYYKIRYEYNGVEYYEETTQQYTLGQKVQISTSLR